MPRPTAARRLLAVAAALFVTTPACGGGDAGGTAGSPDAPSTGTVTVASGDNWFDPQDLTIPAGTEVVWQNVGRVYHNIIPESEDYGFTVKQQQFDVGDSASFVFTTPGTYRYYCSIHGTIDVGMIGTVTVTAA